MLVTPALCLFVSIHLNLRLKFHRFRVGVFSLFHVAVEFGHTSFSVSKHPYHATVGGEVVFLDEKPRRRETPRKSWWTCTFWGETSESPSCKSTSYSLSGLHWMRTYGGTWALHYRAVVQWSLTARNTAEATVQSIFSWAPCTQPRTKAIPCMCLVDLFKTVVSVFPVLSLLEIIPAKRHFWPQTLWWCLQAKLVSSQGIRWTYSA